MKAGIAGGSASRGETMIMRVNAATSGSKTALRACKGPEPKQTAGRAKQMLHTCAWAHQLHQTTVVAGAMFNETQW
ncbi:MAG: hypothetical protein EA401_07975 [Planctomycetota bacterium]|nr:MAG: hypothetical protein EA401_07975 [Planctomycetota bacterium]